MHIVRDITLALLGLFAVSAALYPLVPYPKEANEQMEEIERRRKDLNVLFIGPSYVKAQIDTEVFDRKMKKLGHQVRSAKFAMAALRAYELKYWLRRLLEMDFPGLKWVVIDITLSNSPRVASKNWLKGRMIYWHDLGVVPWLYDYYLRNKKMSREEKRDAAAGHLAHVGAHYFNVGQGVEMIRLSRFWQTPLWNKASATAEEADGEPGREFQRRLWLLFGGGGEAKEPPANRQKKAKRDKKKRRNRRARGRDRANARAKLKGKVLKRYLERRAKLTERRKRKKVKYSSAGYALSLRQVVREYGKQAIFVIASVPRLRKTPRVTDRAIDPLVVFNFTDPNLYPELYEVKHRLDRVHLNEKGSRIYTEILADKISKLWKSAGRTDAVH